MVGFLINFKTTNGLSQQIFYSLRLADLFILFPKFRFPLFSFSSQCASITTSSILKAWMPLEVYILLKFRNLSQLINSSAYYSSGHGNVNATCRRKNLDSTRDRKDWSSNLIALMEWLLTPTK